MKKSLKTGISSKQLLFNVSNDKRKVNNASCKNKIKQSLIRLFIYYLLQI